MTLLIRTFLLRSVLFTLLPFYGGGVFASHISGVDIGFECLGGNTYLITLNLFRDCSGITMNTTEDVTLVSDCGQSFTVTLNQTPNSGYEISQLCPPALPLSDCTNGGYPGMEAYTYQTQVTLNPPCDGWTLSWSTCCRNPTVNSPNSITDDIYAESVLNTVTAPCNSSPIFTAQPIPFVCLNQPVSYNYGVFDPDGDSLVFSLIDARQDAITNLIYGPGFTGSVPIPGITLDVNTGEVNFTPTQIGNYIVVIEVTEYDAFGNVIGTVMRDMQFTVIACTNIIPDAPVSMTNLTGTAIQTGPTGLEMCVGDQFCLDLIFTDQNIGDSLTLTTNATLALPGATFTQTGVNPATATVCWTAVSGTSPVTTFTVFAEDDACPVTGLNQQTVTVLFLPRTLTVTDTLFCTPTPLTLNATGGNVFSWSVLSGEPIQLGVNFSCNPCNAPVATPSITTTYMVQSDLQTTCVNTDTVTINVVPPFGFTSVTTQNATCHGDGDGWVHVSPWGAAGPPWTFEVLQNGNPISSLTTQGADTLTGLYYGTYDLVLTEPLGCQHDTTFSIGQPDPLIAMVDDTTICFTTSAVLSAQATGGNGGTFFTWNQGLAGSGPHTVTPLVTTNYQVTATDALGCTSPTDLSIVTVHPPLDVQASGPDSICINSTAVLNALPSGGNGGPYTLSWEQLGAGPIGTGTSLSVTPNTFTTWYRVTLTDGCGTPAVRDSVHVQWYAAPAPDFVADRFEDCFPAGVSFTNTTDPDDVGSSCIWDFGDGGTAAGCAGVFHSFTYVGCYDVSLTVTSPEGCVGDTTFPQYVCARPYPVADFSWTPTDANVLDPEVAFLNASQYDVTWSWSFGEGCEPDSAFEPNPIVMFPEDDERTYPVWLRVTNQYGCPDSVVKFVLIQGIFFVYVPNAFTPDGDGVNDLFGAQGQGIDKAEFQLTVFDRWGKPVYLTTDRDKPWDGTHGGNGGEPAMQGVYAWKLEVTDAYKGFRKEYLGHVTLAR